MNCQRLVLRSYLNSPRNSDYRKEATMKTKLIALVALCFDDHPHTNHHQPGIQTPPKHEDTVG